MRRSKVLSLLALVTALALVVAACAPEEEPEVAEPDEEEEPEEEPEEEETPVEEEPEEDEADVGSIEGTGLGVYGADGLAAGDLNDDVDPGNPNVLDGFKGTAPDRFTAPDFIERLEEFDPDLDDFTFAAQAWDCTTLIGLAAVAAGSFDGSAIAAEMVALTRGDNECESFEECAQLLEDGESISLRSASGLEEWTDWGDPSAGTYEVWEWEDGALETLEGGIVAETLEAIEEPDFDAPEAPDDPPEPEDTFRLGYVLPETGPLAFLGPPQIRSVEMAVDEINEAGGILGADVELFPGDEAGDATIAGESVDSLLDEGVHAIVGAAASGMSLAIIDQITGEGVLQCSASNTAPDFTGYPDNGLYFRTAPSDVLQGPLLADEIAADGYTRVSIMARPDDYGVGLANAVAEALEEVGVEVVFNEAYADEAPAFDAEVESALAADPDAVVLVSFDEGVELLQELIEQAGG